MPGGTAHVSLLASESAPQVQDVEINPNLLPVRLATTANVADLAAGAPLAVDGVNVEDGDRVAVVAQTDTSENGIYLVLDKGTGADGVWVRDTDMDSSNELVPGKTCFVMEGATLVRRSFTLGTQAVGTIGVTPLPELKAQTLMTEEMGLGYQSPVTVPGAPDTLVLRWFPRQNARVTSVQLFCDTAPTCAGNYTLAAAKAGGGNLFFAASYNLETLVDDTRTSILLTNTDADLLVTPADYIEFTFTSTAAVAAGAGLTLIVKAKPE